MVMSGDIIRTTRADQYLSSRFKAYKVTRKYRHGRYRTMTNTRSLTTLQRALHFRSAAAAPCAEPPTSSSSVLSLSRVAARLKPGVIPKGRSPWLGVGIPDTRCDWISSMIQRVGTESAGCSWRTSGTLSPISRRVGAEAAGCSQVRTSGSESRHGETGVGERWRYPEAAMVAWRGWQKLALCIESLAKEELEQPLHKVSPHTIETYSQTKILNSC